MPSIKNYSKAIVPIFKTKQNIVNNMTKHGFEKKYFFLEMGKITQLFSQSFGGFSENDYAFINFFILM